MGMSDYVRALRAKVGNDLLFMPSVASVVRGDAGRLLIVRHAEGRWMLPGGAVDPGERPADAARRECWEEARVLVDPLRVLGVYGGSEYGVTYENGDRLMWVVTVFEARLVSGEPTPDGEETTEARWAEPAELERLEASEATRTTLRNVLGGVPFVEASWQPE